jgi:hypothetical protein
MKEFNIDLTLDFEPPQTDRARELIRIFGLREERIRHQRLRHRCRIRVRPGDIIYLTGANGAGKSVLLNAMYEQAPPSDRLRLDDIALPGDRPVIDCIDKPLFASADLLTHAGISDIFSMLQAPAILSTGQQHRYRMARAMTHPATFIFADEYTSSMDRIAAAGAAFRLRKLSHNSGKVFILASCHEDILKDLQPDILIIKTYHTEPRHSTKTASAIPTHT